MKATTNDVDARVKDGHKMTISVVMADGGETSISDNSINVEMVDEDDNDGCLCCR